MMANLNATYADMEKNEGFDSDQKIYANPILYISFYKPSWDNKLGYRNI